MRSPSSRTCQKRASRHWQGMARCETDKAYARRFELRTTPNREASESTATERPQPQHNYRHAETVPRYRLQKADTEVGGVIQEPESNPQQSSDVRDNTHTKSRAGAMRQLRTRVRACALARACTSQTLFWTGQPPKHFEPSHTLFLVREETSHANGTSKATKSRQLSRRSSTEAENNRVSKIQHNK